MRLDSANLSKEELARKVQQYVPGFYIHFAPIGQDPDKRNYIVSSDRLRQAGEIMSGFPQAMQLRSLIALQGIAGDKSSTIVFPLPMEVAGMLGVGRVKDGNAG